MGAFVLVKNSTNKTVSQVVLYGRGDSETVKTLKPGATRLTRIAPTSESDLAVTFTVDGRRVQAHPDGYFGSSPLYIVTAEIRPDLTVRVNSGLVGSR